MFNRKQPFKPQRGDTQRVQSASGGHWHEGKWYPASSGQAGPQQRGGQRAQSRGNGGRGKSAGRSSRSSYDSGDFGDAGGSGLSRRIGFRF